jgi:hypothetical protein
MERSQVAEIEEHLTAIDKQCIDNGEPILSVLVRDDDGRISHVTLASILKYKLARPEESLTETILRLQQEAFAFAQRRT